jgi:hypothetical protein
MAASQRKRVGYYIKKDDDKLDVCIQKFDFNQACIDELEQYSQVVFKLLPILISCETVNLSYHEFKQCIDKHNNNWLEQSIIGIGSIFRSISSLVELTQKVTNLLSSVTAFLTSTEIKLKMEFGKDGPQYISWNNLRKELHSDSFSYRFLYGLRNYSQHKNIPLSGIDVDLNDILTDNPIVESALYINKNELLNSGYKWKDELKSEINTQDDKINLIPLVDEYVSIIKKLSIAYLDFFQKELLESHQYIESFFQIYHIPNNAIPVLFVGDTIKGQPVPNRIENLPSEQLLWILKKYQEIKNPAASIGVF